MRDLDKATLWLASTADVARADGNAAKAEIAEGVLAELTQLRKRVNLCEVNLEGERIARAEFENEAQRLADEVKRLRDAAE